VTVSHGPDDGQATPHIAHRVFWAIFHFLGWLSATLLLWMSWQAGLLDAASHAASEHWRSSDLNVVLWLTALEAAVLGLSVWALMVGLTRAARGKVFFHHPGHWLLLVIGLTAVGHTLVGVVEYYWSDTLIRLLRPGASWGFAVAAALLFVKPIVYGLAIRVGAGGFRWRLVFWALVLWTLCDAITFVITTHAPIWRFHRWTSLLSSTLSQVSAEPVYILLPFLVVALPAAATLDYRNVTRDWPHWIGVGSTCWMVLFRLVALQPV
jgi:hypothetical protein